ncbi:hypothetical protein GCM10010492_36190 [Saccharothrix mutabilis subsp. mutabilis]|uniref:NACHT domain-containing protein n=1 Tax=Saccharothrix mutabilis subsp. mutabilis TaxID=66855 RepID=A0ABP3DML3_9PSEU
MTLGRWWVVGGAFATGVVGVLVWLSGSEDTLERGDKLASVAGALMTFAGLVTSVIALVVALRAHRAADPRGAADALARSVARQWEREAAARGLTRPLDVPWASTTLPVAPAAAEVVGDPRVKRLRLRGTVADMARTFVGLPARQLVVIGAPGAGKTSAAILLTLSLVERRAPGDPVPLLLPLSTWDPAEPDLSTWIVRRLAADHPAFGANGAYGPAAARALVDGGMVLPVLDGLDEVAPAGRAAVARAVTTAVGRDRPLVLTARSAEYQEVISGSGTTIGRAAVVELGTVRAEAAADYLASGVPDGDHRWDAVLAELRRHPEGVLARALSTPLAVYLAKTAYAPSATDPADLLTSDTPEEVDRHLLDAYLPALYPEADRATRTRWLAFLARRLERKPGTDLSWWRLFLLLPRPDLVVPAGRGALLATLVAVLITVRITLRDWRAVPVWVLLVGAVAFALTAAVVGGAVGGLLGLLRFARDEERLVALPRFNTLGPRQVAGRLLLGAAVGAVIQTALSLVGVTGYGIWAGVWGGAAFGAVLSANLDMVPRIQVDVPVHPAVSLRADRRASIALAVWTALCTFFPLVVLDPRYAGSFHPKSVWPSALIAIALAVLWPLSCAWVKFGIARFWFWVFRKTPWRLMEFLEDAHRRGVLRQVGGSYQFRHLRIREYLAKK